MPISVAIVKKNVNVDVQMATHALHIAISEVLEENIPPLTKDMRLFEDLRMDSTTMLETLMILEESLDFKIDPEELDIEDFLTVEKYSSFLVEECAQ